MLQDLRFAVRSLSRRPGFLATAVLTCGLGVGASATLFSVVDGVLLRPFPYRASERIAILWHEFGHGAQNLPAVHPLDVEDYRQRSRLFEEMTIASGRREILGGATDRRRSTSASWRRTRACCRSPGAAGFLAFVAFVACFVPAERAARVEPLTALRQD